MTARRFACLWLVLFVFGAGLRAIDLWHGVDGTVRESWRECDVAAIARNYYREDPRFLYPRIDWRGDGPGFVEMELPVTPWLISRLYRLFGFHEVLGRLLVYAFSLLTLATFFRLAHYLLPNVGALAASVFFVLSPLAVRVSNTLQPDGFMLLCYVAAVYGYLRWLDTGSWWDYALALAATALAVLGKASAAHIGVLFALLLFHRRGLAAARDPRVWAGGVLSLAPALLWHVHARRFWITYGNSLGVSNEYHWVSWDFFVNPRFIVGILTAEIFYVWMSAGLLVAAFGVALRGREPAVHVGLFWLGALFALYLIASRALSGEWSIYYHVVSVPAAALLVGAGAEALASSAWPRPPWMVALGGIILSIFTVGFSRASHLTLRFGSGPRVLVGVLLALIAFSVLLIHVRALILKGTTRPAFLVKLAVIAVWVSLPLTLLFQAKMLVADFHPHHMQAWYACARQFGPLIPEQGLIVASGIACKDSYGNPAAGNEPFMFYWLDRKGFNICNEDQSVRALLALSQRGARYFVARIGALDARRGFEAELRDTFPVLSECRDWLLFDLSPRPTVFAGPTGPGR